MADIQEFINVAVAEANADYDIDSYTAERVGVALEALLDGCEVYEGEDDGDYTWFLASEWVTFAGEYDIPGGSKGDYCAEAVRRAINQCQITIRIVDENIKQTLIAWIEDHALYPQDELDKLERFGII